jgi:integrase
MPRPRPTGPQLEFRRGVWNIVWWEGDARRRSSTGTANDTRARQALADFEASLERRPLIQTVAEALDRYEAMKLGKIMAHSRLAEAAKPLKEAIGPLRVDQINQDRWDRYAASRVTRPRPRQKNHIPQPVSTGTLRREFNVLRAALRLSWTEGNLVKPPKIEPPADSQPRDRYLTKTEAKALIAAAKTPHVRTFVALAIYTGARRGAILSLTWDRVDLATGMIDFQEPGRQITSKRRSIVPITTGLRPHLETAFALRQCEYVVEFNKRPVPTGLRWSFGKLCEAAGLTWKPTPHHFKHSVASWFAMDGVPVDQAADWLATDAVTLRRTYRKFDPTYLRSVAGALDL